MIIKTLMESICLLLLRQQLQLQGLRQQRVPQRQLLDVQQPQAHGRTPYIKEKIVQ